MHLLFRDALLVTCDGEHRVLRGDLRVRDGLVAEVGTGLPLAGATVVDIRGRWLLPGFSQPHVHLCQTIFRGLADDLPLLDWLRTRIWPLEAAHDEESVYFSARLGLTELLLGGTTAILDMGTVRHTGAVFQACAEAGIRACAGRALMDRPNEAGLSQPTEAAIQEACDEADRWHGRGRLSYAFTPRFVPSCTPELLRAVAGEARSRGCLLHTHASENRDELRLVRQLTGRDNITYLHELGLSGPDVCLAHCIHLSEAEIDILARTGTRVAHCPSSNLKLGSGVARIPEMLAAGIVVGLGADGAPCNNRLDIFSEMRLAALVQKPRLGPATMPAALVLDMATRAGAEILRTGAGSIEPGRPADLVEIDPRAIHSFPSPDPLSALAYSLDPSAVRTVWIGGQPVARDGRVLAWDTADTLAGARSALLRVRARAESRCA